MNGCGSLRWAADRGGKRQQSARFSRGAPLPRSSDWESDLLRKELWKQGVVAIARTFRQNSALSRYRTFWQGENPFVIPMNTIHGYAI